MDSLQKKLGSPMDGKTGHLLPVTASVAVGVAEKTLPHLSASVTWVIAWAYLNAMVLLSSHISGLVIYHDLNRYHVPCTQSTLYLRCYKLTGAEAMEETALRIVMVCCTLFQLAAPALALRRCSRRRDLTRLVLALTIVVHCMYAAVGRLYLAANPGDIFYWNFCTVAIAFFAVGDIVSLLAIVWGRED